MPRRLRRFVAKVKDVSEFLIGLGMVKPTHPINMKVAYHDACHLRHAQQIYTQPRQLLSSIPGLELIPLPESELCCGAAGSYNLTQPEMADRLGERKAERILATGCDAVAAGNVGCILQIAKHLRAKKPTLAHISSRGFVVAFIQRIGFMKFPVLARKTHAWGAIIIAVPLGLVIVTGLLLQVKKQFTWVQPTELRGQKGDPTLTMEQILTACRGIPESPIQSWNDIDRIDLRPAKGMLKIKAWDHTEVQLDARTGEVLQVGFRRSDIIESLHDGSWFGEWTKLGCFCRSVSPYLACGVPECFCSSIRAGSSGVGQVGEPDHALDSFVIGRWLVGICYLHDVQSSGNAVVCVGGDSVWRVQSGTLVCRSTSDFAAAPASSAQKAARSAAAK